MATVSSVLTAKPETRKATPKLDPRESFESVEVQSEAVGYFTEEQAKSTYQEVNLGSIDFNSPQSEATFEVKDNANTTFATSNNPAFDSWAQMITESAVGYLYGVPDKVATTFVESGKDVIAAGADLMVKDILGLGEKVEPKKDPVKPGGEKKPEVIAFQRQRMHMFAGEKARALVAKQEAMMKLALRMEVSITDDSSDTAAADLELSKDFGKEHLNDPYHMHARRAARMAHIKQAEIARKKQSIIETAGPKRVYQGNFEGGNIKGSSANLHATASAG